MALLRMVAPGAEFRGVTLFWSRNRLRPKRKQGLRIRFSPQISGVIVSHHNMLSPQNGVTQSSRLRPPDYNTALTDEIKVLM